MRRPATLTVGDKFLFHETACFSRAFGGELKKGAVMVLKRVSPYNDEYATHDFTEEAGDGRTIMLYFKELDPMPKPKKKRAVKAVAQRTVPRITQGQQILAHLRRREYITDVEASGLYGIGQVAYVVHMLKKKGHVITSTSRPAVKVGATYYTEYRLIED